MMFSLWVKQTLVILAMRPWASAQSVNKILRSMDGEVLPQFQSFVAKLDLLYCPYIEFAIANRAEQHMKIL